MNAIRPRRILLVAGALTAVVLTACGGGDAGGGDAGGGAAADADSILTVVAGDTFYEQTELSADAGTIAIELDNQGQIPHNVVIEQNGTKVVEAQGGQTATGTVDLESGTYTFYCDIIGHREAGMEGSLEVS